MYQDLNLKCIPHPNTKDIVQVYDHNAVKQSVRHLLMTVPGEKPFIPEFGCGVGSLLFETLDSTDTTTLMRVWNEQMTRYEPRARIIDVNIETDTTAVYIDVSFETTDDTRTQFSMPIRVTRLR